MNIFRRRKTSAEPEPQPNPRDPELAQLHAQLQVLAGARPSAPDLQAARDRPEIARRVAAEIAKVSVELNRLSQQIAHGAARLDPLALQPILDRMHSLGDATVRQVEGRIGVTVSRDDRRQLQELRDAIRDWLAARDEQRENALRTAEEWQDYAEALRAKLLTEAVRLSQASGMAARVAVLCDGDPARAVSDEAGAFAIALRALLTGPADTEAHESV